MSDLKQEFTHQTRHEEMLSALETREIGGMPYEQRGKLVQHFTRHVLGDAQEKRRLMINRSTGHVTVDEQHYPREIAQIVRLLKSMKLSDYTMNWANTRGRELALELSERFPFEVTAKNWDDMTRDQRKEFLQDLVKLQAHVFQKGAISFLPSQVRLDKGTGAMGFVRRDLMEMERLGIPPINIHPKLLEKGMFQEACVTAVHEQLHALFSQLAIASNVGQLPANHPMAEDAKMLFIQYKYFGYATSHIKSAYEADAEEAVTHSCHKAFANNYNAAPPPERSNRYGFMRLVGRLIRPA